MNRTFLPILCAGLILTFCSWAEAAERAPSVDELWKIIQQQQKQIDALNQKLEASAKQNDTEKPAAPAASTDADTKMDDVKEVSRKTDILSQEVEKLRTALVIPEEKALKSEYGLGPAASKVYHADKGLSIGGYGEGSYQNVVSDQGSRSDNADFLRAVIYLGYKFNDNILFNSEVEFEHASTEKNGAVSVEFANLDFLLDPVANIRAGLVLQPVGFINLIHESPYFFGNQRPEVERRIIPSTWSDIGLGLFGEILPGLTYTTYGINGLDAKGFSSTGIRSGRQSGSEVIAEDLAWVMRVDYTPPVHPGLTVGTSTYLGNSGQNQLFAGRKINVFTQLYEAHLQWKYFGWEFRALGAWGHVGDAAILSLDRGETVGKSNYGWYTEIGYNLLPWLLPDTTQYLVPFFRYEQYDTIASAPSGFGDNPNLDRRIFQFGLQYKPIPNIVIKADYRNFSAKVGTVPDEFNLGIGYVF
ncbi:MAG: hypothetical protein ACRER2_18030 [Methylococcales bacterium]